ncbi:MAG TPA: bacillithiol biosynthesis cysteine-adding enzyme BshC [Longimicrobiaceae bacterium]|nr:bacillithiol biosynthesis cysteine-adding enzyme BshC [Longimicrobiaceae bacterium]
MEDHLAGSPAAAPFYQGHPRSLRAYREKLDEVRARFGRAERERAAAALRPTSARAAERLRRFVEEGGAVVTTGQQPALFTGPLYTAHKVLNTVRLAAALEARLGAVVLPVFWSGSEDHDFAEANHTFAVDGEGRLHRLAVRPTRALPFALSEMPLGDDVESTLDDFEHVVASNGDARFGIRLILDAFLPGVTLADAYRQTIEALFAPFDLLVTDAADPALKAASLPALLREAERAAAHERRVAEQTAALAEAGYPAQVTVVEGATNLFFHGPAGRERLYREGDGFVARDSRRRFTLTEVERELARDPRCFSPNVLLRPVVESYVFPTLAYVAGPGETAYFAQAGPLFAAYGIRAPVVFPRLSAEIVPHEVQEIMDRLGLEADELAAHEHEVVTRIARGRVPAEVQARLRELRASLVERFGAVIDAAHGIDPNLDLAIGARRNRALLEVAAVERKVLTHVKRRDPALAREVATTRNHLRPRGEPQERVLNLFPYLARQPTLLEEIAAAMEVELSDD